MDKLISVLLCILLTTFSLAGCLGDSDNETSDEDDGLSEDIEPEEMDTEPEAMDTDADGLGDEEEERRRRREVERIVERGEHRAAECERPAERDVRRETCPYNRALIDQSHQTGALLTIVEHGWPLLPQVGRRTDE